MDTVSKEKRSQIMGKVKSKKTKLENKVLSHIWNKGIRYRRNVKSLKGKPDIAIKKYKLVIFIDSCFWHGCIKHFRLPKSNTKYWITKIDRNRKRDQEVTKNYIDKGWNILRIWEHQLSDDFDNTMVEVLCFINKAKNFK